LGYVSHSLRKHYVNNHMSCDGSHLQTRISADSSSGYLESDARRIGRDVEVSGRD